MRIIRLDTLEMELPLRWHLTEDQWSASQNLDSDKSSTRIEVQ